MPRKRSADEEPEYPASGSKKAKKEKVVKEKRCNAFGATVRYRSNPSIKDSDRIDRALSRGLGVLLLSLDVHSESSELRETVSTYHPLNTKLGFLCVCLYRNLPASLVFKAHAAPCCPHRFHDNTRNSEPNTEEYYSTTVRPESTCCVTVTTMYFGSLHYKVLQVCVLSFRDK